MDELLAARSQMALSLGFHIIFASIGMAMPFLMSASYFFYLKKKDEDHLRLTKAWAKGVAIFFAVGAVSGTALSFELGLLWPGFMKHAGPIIGMPFSWEGTAFFLEAIFLGIFLYGWNRIHPWAHWTSSFLVGVCGVASAYFVIAANGWMNSPAGFDWNNGNPINIDPWAAMFNDAFFMQATHMTVAAFSAVGFAVGGLHSFLYMKTKHAIHFKAMKTALMFAAVASIIQPLIGDLSAKSVAIRQPIKLAAMEGHFETKAGADLVIGGIPDEETGKTNYAIHIPKFLSFLAFGDFDAEVKGLNDFDRENWPPVLITHLAFQIMVGIGMLLAAAGFVYIFALKKKRHWLESKRFLMAMFLMSPLGFMAIEAGWIVTEVGRQPWIIYGVMKTSEALTPRPGIWFSFGLYAFIYALLSVVVALLLTRQIGALHREIENEKTEKGAQA